jgi:hypothetical protein
MPLDAALTGLIPANKPQRNISHKTHKTRKKVKALKIYFVHFVRFCGSKILVSFFGISLSLFVNCNLDFKARRLLWAKNTTALDVGFSQISSDFLRGEWFYLWILRF